MDITDANRADLRESLNWFEAALASREPKIVAPDVGALLLALDGSNQDETSEKFAAELARHYQSRIVVGYAYEGPRDDERRRHAAETVRRLTDQGQQAELAGDYAQDIHRERSFNQILSIQQKEDCDLIIVCAPYLEDFQELGKSSVGTNLDMLLAKSPVPILAVREEKSRPADCFDEIVLPITPYKPETVKAAAWAMRTVSPEGRIRILAVVDRETIDSTSALAEGETDYEHLDDEILAGLNRPDIAGLIGALQRKASEAGYGCRVSVRSGEVVEETVRLAEEGDALIVTACPRKPESAATQRVQGLIRASRNPVLVL